MTVRVREAYREAYRASKLNQPQPAPNDYADSVYVDPASDPVGLKLDALFADPDTVEASEDEIQQWREEQRNERPPDYDEDEL